MRVATALKHWLPALVWSAFLLSMSGSAGSGGVTGAFLHRLLPFSDLTIDALNALVRRCIHIFAYALLGALYFRAARGRREGWTLRWAVAAVILTVIVAALDEWHQSMVPGRTGTMSDVIFDGFSAMLAQVAYGHALNYDSRA